MDNLSVLAIAEFSAFLFVILFIASVFYMVIRITPLEKNTNIKISYSNIIENRRVVLFCMLMWVMSALSFALIYVLQET